MGRGNNKFAALNLNDIYGKKEPKPKPPTATTNGNTSGNHPPGYMLVLTRQKQPSLVAKDDEDKTISVGSISTPSPLQEERVNNPWAINPVDVCKEDHENEKKNAEEHVHGKTKSKGETLICSKPGLGIPQPGAAKIEGELGAIPPRDENERSAAKIEGELGAIPTYIPPRRPSPPREIRDWDDDERSTILPLHQQNRGTYFGDDRDAYYNNNNMNNHQSRQKHSGGNRNVNLNTNYPVKGDNGDTENNTGGGQGREVRYGYRTKQNAFHH